MIRRTKTLKDAIGIYYKAEIVGLKESFLRRYSLALHNWPGEFGQ